MRRGAAALAEAMVWPNGRLCPASGLRRSITLAGRDMERQPRPGLYHCCNSDCPFQFTVTTGTPLHGTKLPLRTWLMGLWFIPQSDKGISSIRLVEALGVSQPTAWRMGHTLRRLVLRDHPVGEIVKIDEFHFGASPRRDLNHPKLERGRNGQLCTTKTPALAVSQRPSGREP